MDTLKKQLLMPIAFLTFCASVFGMGFLGALVFHGEWWGLLTAGVYLCSIGLLVGEFQRRAIEKDSEDKKYEIQELKVKIAYLEDQIKEQ